MDLFDRSALLGRDGRIDGAPLRVGLSEPCLAVGSPEA